MTNQGSSGRAAGFSRRSLLGLTATAGAGVALSACTGGGQTSEKAAGQAGGDTGSIAWWDQYRPLTKLFESDIFAGYMKEHAGVKITRREMEAADLGQALQLAKRSNQLPDVFSTAGLESAAAALVDEKWFQPIGDLADVAGSPVADFLYDGIHRFDGKIYTFPVFSGRVHDAIPWTNTELLKAADVDPDSSPATWDDLRSAARTLTKKTDDVYGIVLPGKEPGYLEALVTRLAQTAGAAGPIDWHTGEYAYSSQPFLDAIDYLLALQADKSVHPSSPSMGPRDARARFAAGQVAVYPWGAWIIGGLNVDEPESIERGIGVWHVPTPQTKRNFVYSGPAGGPFWVASSSQHAKIAADVMLRLSTVEVQKKLAETMDVPPVLLDQVAASDAHPTYKKNVTYLEDDVRIAPAPEVGNPAVAQVLASMRDVHPDLGEIVQTALTDKKSDYKAALQKLDDEMTKERDRACAVVSKKGTKIGAEAWVFGNWDRSADYTPESYEQR
ncbi:ABC transporter substrate-binding protein [Microlunatus soli]|uniref:Multiple sugar transport system substrate-binding protein n=1 Tax=Microlunatus soli TaxID=630515 RepID=A0A1H1WID9_9ACTN|nr:extracellular solute-binding protein [Microlunatus soli]SDS96883.1 multiple sugar transport system substrate-binding protein [Microlunatus soli]